MLYTLLPLRKVLLRRNGLFCRFRVRHPCLSGCHQFSEVLLRAPPELFATINRIYIMIQIPDSKAVVALIFTVRGQRVILDSDLALLYGVSTKRLNEQVRRNPDRFPSDFAFRLTQAETKILRSHNATSSWGGRRYSPLGFTEHGAVMAANVLDSPKAVSMSVEVVRAFIRLRRAAVSQGIVAQKLADLERAVNIRLDQHDQDIEELFDAVESLIENGVDSKSPKRIGFLP